MKKYLVLAALLCIVLSLGMLASETTPVEATFNHTWTLTSYGGVGSSPKSSKEVGLWDNAAGATGASSGNGAVLWIECDNGGDGGGPNENEYCRWTTTQIDADPAAGYRYLRVRYCRSAGITFRVRVTYSVYGMALVLTDSTSTTWQTRILTLSTTSGRVRGIHIEIDDTYNSLGSTIDTYMVLIDYINLRNAAGTTIWQENF